MSTHTRGDTFDYSGPLNLSIAGVPTPDLSDWTGRSMIRTLAGVLVSELTFSWVDATLGVARVRSNDTTSWPIGKTKLDIQLTSSTGDVVSTSPVLIEIMGDITYD